MKRILLLLAVFSTLYSTAQVPQLFENDWYLHNLVISGENNIPPSNLEVPYRYLMLGSDLFDTGGCNSLGGDITYNSSLPEFTLGELFETLVACEFIENVNFQNLYFNDFYRANQPSTFSYIITDNPDTSKTLTITGDNGDQAIYGNALLHVNQHRITQIKTYPNPVENQVSIDSGNIHEDIQLSVYDLSGKLILSIKLDSTNSVSVDTSQLITGAYFFVFETNEGRIETQKIIKK